MKTSYAIIILLFIGITSCDYGRTPSKKRLEKACAVKLTSNFTVIKDEYQDMLQDYCIMYDIKFSKSGIDSFTKSIRESKYYNPKVKYFGIFIEDHYVKIDSTKSAWCISENGYVFHKEGPNVPNYWVTVDTLERTLSYQECD